MEVEKCGYMRVMGLSLSADASGRSGKTHRFTMWSMPPDRRYRPEEWKAMDRIVSLWPSPAHISAHGCRW